MSGEGYFARAEHEQGSVVAEAETRSMRPLREPREGGREREGERHDVGLLWLMVFGVG